MSEFPIPREDACNEIKELIVQKGLDVITSKTIRKHLEVIQKIVNIICIYNFSIGQV
jgi:hypothetical protein